MACRILKFAKTKLTVLSPVESKEPKPKGTKLHLDIYFALKLNCVTTPQTLKLCVKNEMEDVKACDNMKLN